MIALTSRSDFSTVSSIRAGWILPSTISFSRDSLAISLLTGSNPERITASGVSSMIRSIPVRVSIALMLRPSLPMIRPFISSLGSGTTDTVDSATWSAAHLWIAPVMISLAFLSASSLALFSISLYRAAASLLASFSTFWRMMFLASSIE